MVPSNLHDRILGWRNESAPTLCWHVVLHNRTKEYCKNEVATGCEGAISLKIKNKSHLQQVVSPCADYCWPNISFSFKPLGLWLFTVQSMSIVMQYF